MRRIVMLIFLATVMIIITAFGTTSATANSESTDYARGKILAEELLDNTKNGNSEKVWRELSGEEKESVKKFASQSKSFIKEMEEKGVDSAELADNLKLLSDDEILAMKVSLIAVDTSNEIIPNDNKLTARYSYGRISSASNLFGSTLWSYTHNIHWQTSGNWLTSASKNVIPRVPGLGWEFIKNTTNTSRGGSGYNFYESEAQGHFKLEILGQSVQNKYPRIWLKGWSNGTVQYAH